MSNQGWECPRCGACYAPWVAKCSTCAVRISVTASTGPICGCTQTDTGGNKIHDVNCPAPDSERNLATPGGD